MLRYSRSCIQDILISSIKRSLTLSIASLPRFTTFK